MGLSVFVGQQLELVPPTQFEQCASAVCVCEVEP